MNYKVINKNNYNRLSEEDLLYTLLKERGVNDPHKLLHLDKTVLNDGMSLNNMDRGLNMLHWHINNNSKIHILYDVDNDGINSGCEIFSYIKDINKNIQITYSINEGKKHGIQLEYLKEYDFNLLIVPDAGSNDKVEVNKLYNNDIDILILDHHQIEQDNPNAIVINCQDGIYPNNTLSAAGVVYKFIKEYDKKYGYNYADKYLDLVAIGMIGDSMDLRNYETRYLVLQGLKQINNDLMKEITYKQSRLKKDQKNSNINIDTLHEKMLHKINIEFVGWKIAPLINAVIRSGTEKEKESLIEAINGIQKNIEYQPRRKHKTDPKPPIEIQSLQKSMARQCVNIKGRQDRQVKKGLDILLKKIENNNLAKNKIIMVDGTDCIEQTFTGLVANKLATIFKRPAIVLRQKGNNKELFGGSCRNYRLSFLPSLLDFLQSLHTFNYLAGHNNAMGFEIAKDKISPTIDMINKKLANMSIEDVYLVDYEIPVGRLKEQHILQVGKWKNIWGNTLRKPLFAITDIIVDTADIQLLGDKKNIIKVIKNIGNTSITFIKMMTNKETYDKMIMKNKKGLSSRKSSKVKLDIIGEFTINNYMGHEYPQINIVDFNVSNVKDFRF